MGAQGRGLEFAVQALDGHRNDERVLRAGKRDIKNAHLLAEGLHADGLRKGGIGQRFIAAGLPGRAQHQPDAEAAVAQHRAHGVALVEFVRSVGDKDDREFEPLGAVHRHDRNAAGAALPAPAGLHAARLLRGVHRTDQRRQAAAARGGSPGGEGQQVFAAARAVRHGPGRRQVAGAGEQFLNQFVHRQRAGQAAEHGKVLQKSIEPAPAAVQHGRIQAAAALLFAQADKVVRRVGIERAEQHRRELDILGGIVENAQQRRERAHMGRVEQVGGGIGKDRYPGGAQRFLIKREVPAAAQQDAEVPVRTGAGAVLAAHGKALALHFGNALRNGRRIGRGVGAVQHADLAQAAVLPRPADDQALAGAVGDAAERRGENGLKDVVDALDDRRGAAEVGVQRDRGRACERDLRRVRVGLPGRLLGGKNAGVGLAEAVDALLEVADEEEVIGRGRGERKINRVLQGVGVLVFIDKHRRIARADRGAQRRALPFRRLQQIEGEVLIVGIVEDFFLDLGGKKGLGKQAHRPHKRRHQRRGAAAVGREFGPRAQQEIALQFLGLFFGALAQLVGRKRRRVAVPPAFDRARAAPFLQQRKRFQRAVPVPCAQAFGQQREFAFVVGEHGRIGAVGGLVPRGGGQGGFDQAQRPLHAARRALQHRAAPGGILRRRFGLPGSREFIERPVRVRQRAGEVVQFKQRGPGCIVGAAAVIKIGKRTEVGVFIRLFQHCGQRFLAQAAERGVIGCLKVGRDFERGKMLLYKVQAERIHRADGRALQPQLLAAQALVAGMGAHFGQQAFGDVGAQLGRGRVRKSHDQQAVGLDRRVGVGDQADGALDQHAGLAGTGGRADQQAAAAGHDGRGLRRGKLDRVGHSGSCEGWGVACCHLSALGGAGLSNGSPSAAGARSPSPSAWRQTAR